jgi:hypothetical protein
VFLAWCLLAGSVVLAAVFLVSQIAKLVDQLGTREAASVFRIPARLSGSTASLLPIFEVDLTVLLLPSVSARLLRQVQLLSSHASLSPYGRRCLR